MTTEALDTLRDRVRAATGADRKLTLADAFEIGYVFRGQLQGQALENSRAVGRLLASDIFDPIHTEIYRELKERGFNSFESADHGIVAVKAIIRAALIDKTREDSIGRESLKGEADGTA